MDEDDKVRRNLVVFSGAVVLLFWLEVPLQPVLRGHLHLDMVNAHRAWIAALVILGYLVLRYRFGEKGAGIRAAVRQLAEGVMYAGVSRRLQAAVNTYFADGKGEPFITFFKFETNLDALHKVNPKEVPALAEWLRQNGYAISSMNIKSASYWYGTGVMDIHFASGPLAPVIVRGLFTIPPRDRMRAALPVVPALAYSAIAVNLILPYVVAVLAFGVILNRLVDSLA